MKFAIRNPSGNAIALLRTAGYRFDRRTERGEMSFVRPLAGRGNFPRFHIYASEEIGSLRISIHLDAKRETYGRQTRHHGEYENEGILAEEVARLKRLWGV
ncbi:MAG TPA: hypothetical protein ENJ77_00350 [Candidatus Moranbacteria bacterium]|nr:hypothetical protein [Candidatus Moranbacteria bacterium]